MCQETKTVHPVERWLKAVAPNLSAGFVFTEDKLTMVCLSSDEDGELTLLISDRAYGSHIRILLPRQFVDPESDRAAKG